MRVALLAAALLCGCAEARGAAGATRDLLVRIDPNLPSQSVPFNSKLKPPRDIPMTDRRVAKLKPGCAEAEQVHLTMWTATSVLVSWATCDAIIGPNAVPNPPLGISSVVRYGVDRRNLNMTATGVVTGYTSNYSSVGFEVYVSPVLHHTLLKELQPGVTYYYVFPEASSPVLTFTMPRATFPLKIGAMADPGQTFDTFTTFKRMSDAKPDILFIGGDFSYADYWATPEISTDIFTFGPISYQPKQDTWGRLASGLLSKVPFLHTDGNHEVEQETGSQTRHRAYNYRYPVPTNETAEDGPTQFAPVSSDQPWNNLYYTVELPGLAKYISLTSYSPNQTFDPSEEQYVWLEEQLKQTNRTVLPWLIVSFHAPWYNSYASHFKENDCMRISYEPLLVQYKVDVILNGHVHSYERTKPIVNSKVDECGPMHLIIGDAGNVEGIARKFMDTARPQPSYCATPTWYTQFPMPYQPQRCLTYEPDGSYCIKRQPEWSAYREPAFGFGTLELLSPTTATWSWFSNQLNPKKPSDTVNIIRNPDKVCP